MPPPPNRFSRKSPPGALKKGSFLSVPNIAGIINCTDGGGQPYDLITGQPGVISGTNPPTWGGRSDPVANTFALSFVAGSTSLKSYVNMGTLSNWKDLAAGPGTIIARIFWAGTQNFSPIAERNDGNTTGGGWLFDVGSTSDKLAFTRELTSTNQGARSSVAVPRSQWCTVAATWTGATGTSQFNLYVNGLGGVGSDINAGAGTSPTDSAQTLNIGNNKFTSIGSVTGSMDGSIAWVMAVRRIMSQAEIAQFNGDGILSLLNPPTALSTGRFIVTPPPSSGAKTNTMIVGPLII